MTTKDMETVKWIEFHRIGLRPVHLDRLSQTAREIALAVESTNYRHPRGTLRVEDTLTWEQRARRGGVAGRRDTPESLATYISTCREVFGDFNDHHQVFEWAWLGPIWEPLPPFPVCQSRDEYERVEWERRSAPRTWAETPESYLERNARLIERNEGRVFNPQRTPEQEAVRMLMEQALFGGPAPERQILKQTAWLDRN